jgi:CRP-like cAMP-binding protein
MEQRLPPQKVKAGPAISALPFLETSNGRTIPLLGEREHSLLAGIASMVQVKRGATIFREGDRADFIYSIAHGVVAVCQTSFEGRRYIATFMFDDDLFGLAEEGVYVNEAQAIAVTTAYRTPVEAFVELMRHEPLLDHSLLLKLTHELREGERHGMILACMTRLRESSCSSRCSNARRTSASGIRKQFICRCSDRILPIMLGFRSLRSAERSICWQAVTSSSSVIGGIWRLLIALDLKS